jgi:ADP-heptose:LPS heptosyltransferase
MKTPKAKKILVIRFSSIGDIVLTTPVIRCLHEQIDAEVHFLTKDSFRTIVDPNPFIKKVYSIKKELSEVIDELKKEDYDYVIDLHKNLRSLQVKRALKAKSHSFYKLNFEKWLMVNFKMDRLPNIHIVDRYLQTVASLGVVYDGKGLDYFIPAEMKIDATQFLADKLKGKQTKFIAFAIGAAHATKRLPTEKIIEICQKINLPVVLLGGPGDKETAIEIQKAVGDSVINTCGELKLHESASLVRQAHKVITHDTGMMHIAAAFDKDIISIWGNTIPEFGMYPYYPNGKNKNITIEVNGLSCRPCSKIGYQKCPKGHFKCMNLINLEKVVNLTNG